MTNIRTLVVDDSLINRSAVIKMFRTIGINDISQATNGSEALKVIRQNEFDLIIMDINMPVLNGKETTQLIVDYYNNLGKECPKIIGLSSNAFADEMQSCIDAGMVDYMRKPPQLSEMEKMINKHVLIA